ncbi:MAG: DUF2130 domain-containing protein, partial [Firmicutes bacterium]|nr:DUF2130 domain-containing protein [Bacillota bacterium]
MQEIKCPHCGQVFQVDESGYASIVQQVRDSEFHKELERREAELREKNESSVKIAGMEQEKVSAEELQRKNDRIAEMDKEIQALKAKLDGAETERKLAVTEAVQEKDKELAERALSITELEGKLESKAAENELRQKSIRDQYENALKMKDEQIEYYKDFKARQSTKMIGESLEQHCQNQFNSIRMTAFPNAYFEKDNDARTGSKGDFIFREASEDGTEFISIMFEMKNEADET